MAAGGNGSAASPSRAAPAGMQVGSAHITRICMTFTIMEYQALAVHSAGSARGHHEPRTLLTA
jgi:hypothetical protein